MAQEETTNGGSTAYTPGGSGTGEHGSAPESRLTTMQAELAAATAQNQRLVSTLREARDQIIKKRLAELVGDQEDLGF